MSKSRIVLTSMIALALAVAVVPVADAQQTKPAAKAEPNHIKVQHVLIGFKGSVRGKNVTRTLEEAEALAKEILEKARKGEDFDALVKEHSDDNFPGIYGMANNNVNPMQGEFARSGMVAAFGDVGFKLEVGEVGLASYDPKKSKYGYHIIKRLE